MKCSNGWRRRSWLSFAGLAGLLLAGLLLAVPVLAQEAAPAQPTGLTADPAHDQVGLVWDDPDDSTITGYRILRRLPALDPPGRVRRAAREHRFGPDHLRRYHRHAANELCLSGEGDPTSMV